MSEELLPCPFCGGEAHFYLNGIRCFDKPVDYIRCTACEMTLINMNTKQNLTEFIELWNKRYNKPDERG